MTPILSAALVGTAVGAGALVASGLLRRAQGSVARRAARAAFGVGDGPPRAWADRRAAVLGTMGRAGGVVRAARWALLVAGVASAAAGSLAPLLVATLVVVVAGEAAGARRRHRGRQAFDSSLAPFAEGIGRSLRSGTSLAQALWDGADGAGGELAREITAVRRRVDAGEPLVSAISRWAAPRSSDDLDTVVAVCCLGAEVGGRLAATFDGCAASMRQRDEVAGELRAMSSQARASMAMLAALPFAVAALMSLLDRGVSTFLLETTGGAVCLAVAVALDVVAFLWMRALVRSVW